MQKEYKKLDIDKIDKLQDEMEEMLDMNNEIQDAMSRQYETPDVKFLIFLFFNFRFLSFRIEFNISKILFRFGYQKFYFFRLMKLIWKLNWKLWGMNSKRM